MGEARVSVEGYHSSIRHMSKASFERPERAALPLRLASRIPRVPGGSDTLYGDWD